MHKRDASKYVVTLLMIRTSMMTFFSLFRLSKMRFLSHTNLSHYLNQQRRTIFCNHGPLLHRINRAKIQSQEKGSENL